MSLATMSPPTMLAQYEKKFAGSRSIYQRGLRLFPHGVTHDLRHLEPFPVYYERAEGAYKWDVDGNKLIDYWSGHGAILLGHSHPDVVAAVQRQMARSTHPGGCHELEVEWGEWVQRLVPSVEKLRFVASGTEATMMAIRLCRIHTGKPKVLKFVGHFHGWHDGVMPEAYSPYHTGPVPGLPAGTNAATVVIRPNDPDLLDRTLAGDPEIGCLILEPTGGHWGSVPIRGEFLKAVRIITARHKVLMICDEVITGFRVGPGGAQGLHGIVPDLTTMAKILAGGLPGGGVGGRADIMAHLEVRPGKPKMKHPGTFNANPLSASAGVATLRHVATGDPQKKANIVARQLRQGLNELFQERGASWLAYGDHSFVRLLPHYSGNNPTGEDFIPYNGDPDQIDAPKDPRFVTAFRQAMLVNGVDMWGLSCMMTAAHTEADVATTIQAVSRTLDLLQSEGLT